MNKFFDYIFQKIAINKNKLTRVTHYVSLINICLLIYNTILLRQLSLSTSLMIFIVLIIGVITIAIIDDKYIHKRELCYVYGKISQLTEILTIVKKLEEIENGKQRKDKNIKKMYEN